jgi:tetratricopeptide (TPR) repeat protein
MSLSILIGDLAKILVAASLSALPSCAAAGQLAPPAKEDPATQFIDNGIRLFGKKEFAAATLQFKAAAKANPRSADALTWLGIAENQMKEYAEARANFEAALRIDSTRLPAHYNLALNLIRTGQFDLAIEQLEIVVLVQPGVLEPEYNLALLLEQNRAISEAIEHLKAAYKADPDDPGVVQHLLVDLLATGREDEARPILDRMRNASREARRQVGTALIETGSYKQAIAILEDTPIQSKRSYRQDMLLARAYIGAHEDFKAINILKSSETLDNTGEVAYLLGLAYFLLGRACQHAGDTAQATEWIAKLKDLKRKHEREDAAAVSDSKPVTSSTLLRGAPVTTVQIEGP